MKKTCLRCGKEFSKLGVHLIKTVCKPKFLNIDGETILKNYDELFEEYKKLLNKKYECEYCHKVFSQSQGYYKHKIRYCLEKPLDLIQETESQQNQPVEEPLVISTNSMLNSHSHSSHSHSHNSHNSMLNSHNSMIYSTINSGTMNITNNNYNTIVVNNFGEEAPLSVRDTVAILNKCIKEKKLDEILPMYVQKRWIDNENNRNINITDVNRGVAEVYVNKEWEKRFLSEIIDKIRNKSTTDIRKYLENVKTELEKKYKIKYQDDPRINHVYRASNQMYDIENEPQIKRDANKKIKMKLVNGRKQIRETKKKI